VLIFPLSAITILRRSPQGPSVAVESSP
jgi:hypothetical protein